MKLGDAITLLQSGQLDESQNLISNFIEENKKITEKFLEIKLLHCEILFFKEHFYSSLNELDLLLLFPELSEFEIIKIKVILLKSEILHHLSKIDESFILFQEAELNFEKSRKKFGNNSITLEIRLLRIKGAFLQFHGKLNEAESAYNKSQTLARTEGFEFELSFTLNLLGMFNLNTGKIEISKQLIDESHNIGLKLKNDYLLVKSYNSIGAFFQIKGDLDAALVNFEKAMKIAQKLDLQDSMVVLFNSFGLISQSMGDTNKALEYHHLSLKFNEKLEIKTNVSISYNNIGLIYLVQGDLDKALKYQLQSLQIGKGVFDEIKYVGSYNNIGLIYSQKGELDKALHNHFKYLQTAEKYNIKTDIATAYVNIGLIHQIKSEYVTAHDYFIKCLEIDREIGNEIDLAESLYNLLILELERDRIENSKQYLDELMNIDLNLGNKIVNLRSRLGLAIFNKYSNRFITRAKAQEILTTISKESVIDHELTVYAKMNLCEMLLNELKITGNPEVLTEINDLVDNLHTIAEDQVSYKLKAENYLLRSNLELIESNYEKAIDLLQKADIITREKGLTSLSIKISDHFDNILQRKEAIQSFDQNEAPIKERLDEIGLEDLIVKMIKPYDMKVKPEQPAYFFILTQGGVTIYSRSFLDTGKKKELIGGLLTAIYTMGEDVFVAENSVQRIKHNDYTVIIKPVQELLFSYVFTGSSYNAMEKLEKLTLLLSESELIWSALIRDLPQISISEKNGLDIIISDMIINSN
ncbi:MAG: tetratricopeptide repeat protein [Candidatus Heimdallarchaeota archaeon]|nr:tetratricopeptide repeat protein [Candidatus Heimdallarchaeota archaeon]